MPYLPMFELRRSTVSQNSLSEQNVMHVGSHPVASIINIHHHIQSPREPWVFD